MFCSTEAIAHLGPNFRAVGKGESTRTGGPLRGPHKRNSRLAGEARLGRRPAPGGLVRPPPAKKSATALRILLVEDSPADAELTRRELARGGLIARVTVVDT